MFSVKEKLEKRRKLIFFIFLSIFIVSLCACAFCLFRVFKNKFQNDKANDEYKKIVAIKEQNNKEDEIPQFHKELLAQNPDYIAWIEIPGTPVNYPIVQADDNNKYLKLTFKCEENEAGAIFADCTSDPSFESANTIIHGHSRLDKSMFGSLHNFKEKEYMKKNSKLIIKRRDGKDFVYRIFSSNVVNVENAVYTSREDEEEARNYVDSLGTGKDKKIVTLSTCVSAVPGSSERRIVQAVLEE